MRAGGKPKRRKSRPPGGNLPRLPPATAATARSIALSRPPKDHESSGARLLPSRSAPWLGRSLALPIRDANFENVLISCGGAYHGSPVAALVVFGLTESSDDATFS